MLFIIFWSLVRPCWLFELYTVLLHISSLEWLYLLITLSRLGAVYLFTQTSTTFALFIDYLFLGSFIDCIRVAPAGYYLFTDLFTTLLIALKSSLRHLLCVIIYYLFRRQDIFIACVYSSWALFILLLCILLCYIESWPVFDIIMWLSLSITPLVLCNQAPGILLWYIDELLSSNLAVLLTFQLWALVSWWGDVPLTCH